MPTALDVIPDTHRDLLSRTKGFAHVATIGPTANPSPTRCGTHSTATTSR
jgi:hypothetical protein